MRSGPGRVDDEVEDDNVVEEEDEGPDAGAGVDGKDGADDAQDDEGEDWFVQWGFDPFYVSG